MKKPLIRRAGHLLAAIILFAPFSGLALNLDIRTAVELEFPTEKGAGYQLLVSPDLETWEPSGRQIIGTGDPVRLLTSARNNARFHRLESFPCAI